MAKRTCDGCGARVSVGGGAETLWTSGEAPGGVSLTLADDTDHFLCFDCVERLPDDRDATAADVAALETGPEPEADVAPDHDPDPE